MKRLIVSNVEYFIDKISVSYYHCFCSFHGNTLTVLFCGHLPLMENVFAASKAIVLIHANVERIKKWSKMATALQRTSTSVDFLALRNII